MIHFESRLAILVLSCACLGTLTAQSDRAQKSSETPAKAAVSDKELVRRAVEDYVHAIYKVEAARVERSVDKNLAKFGLVRRNPQQAFQTLPMTFAQLKKLAASYNKSGRIKADAPQKIEVLDVLPRIAFAKLTAAWGIDYMQLHKNGKRWQIRHVAWQQVPKDSAKVTDADRKAIKTAVTNYARAFYEAKPELIDASVSKDLTKFGYYNGRAMPMSFDQLKSLAAGLHKGRPPENQRKDVEILDVLNPLAAVKLAGAWGIDYMHLTKLEGKWQIKHVIWQSHPPKVKPAKRNNR